jgi:hypothetical protein
MPFVDAFSVTTRWSFDNVFTSIHHVDYSILDHDFNAYTDDMGLWWASKQAAYLLRQAGVPESVIRHGWAERGADVRRGQSQPCMSAMQVTGSWPGNLNAVDEISMDYDASCFDEEMFSGTGSIIHRTQAFLMPSIEYWRLVHHPIVHNLPDVLTAFRI